MEVSSNKWKKLFSNRYHKLAATDSESLQQLAVQKLATEAAAGNSWKLAL